VRAVQRGPGAVAAPRGEGAAPLVVAHRGAWGDAPQNSLAAFAHAVALGCDAIELDVRRTSDKRIVVVHDARIGGRSVGRLEHDQLQARLKGGQAPPLEEVLELAVGRLIVDIELKEEGYVRQAMELVAKRLAPDQYVVTSFRDSVLPDVKRWAPEAQTGLLVSPRAGRRDLESRVARSRVDFLAPHASVARAGMLEWAGQRDLASWVWTVNDARGLQALHADPRVAAVITDRPGRALALSHAVDRADNRE